MSTTQGVPQAMPQAMPQAIRLQRPGQVRLANLPPLSLYLHLPWCLKKCPYCDFNSHAADPAAAPLPWARYLQALRADLEASLPQVWGRRVHSVFIGGGTPSLLAPDLLAQLLSELRALLPLQPQAEITLEANPGTFERERFAAYRRAGVTRLSLGVQSFDDAKLHALGRVHDAAQAHAAAAEAAAQFDTFNLDLMYALPGQTLPELERELDTALAYAPPHLSLYQLTLEPNTWFARHPPAGLPDEDNAYAMLDAIAARCQQHGLQRYEVSAYSRAGHACAHNLNYWRFGDYLGLGAGAHSKISRADGVLRQVRWREPERYMAQALQGQAASSTNEVPASDLPFEFMLNALRLRAGFALSDFFERTGLGLEALAPALAQAEARGWIERSADGQQVRASARGFDFLSDLQALFLP